MKIFGKILWVVVLGSSTYLIFGSQFELTRISLFATIGIATSIFFILHDRIILVKTPFWELKTELDKARSNAKEIEEILTSIKSQKDMIDLIVRDASATQRQMSQIETIANQAHIKAQETERDQKDAKSKEEKEKIRRELKHMSSTGRRD